jgi:hypothetical protein
MAVCFCVSCRTDASGIVAPAILWTDVETCYHAAMVNANNGGLGRAEALVRCADELTRRYKYENERENSYWYKQALESMKKAR